MSTVLRLLKLQIDNKTDLLKTASPAKMILSILKVVIPLLCFTLLMALVLLKINMAGIVFSKGLLSVVLLVTQILSLIFAVGNVISTLYLCKDNELLICLPVSPNQLFISKILLIYFKELLINAFITVPLFVGLGLFGGFGASFFFSFPILLLLLPVLPIVLAAFISIPIMAIMRFLKHHPLLAILTILLLVSAFLWMYIALIGNLAGSFNIATDQVKTVIRINNAIKALGAKIYIYAQLSAALCSFSSWYWYSSLLLLCTILSVGTFYAIRPVYFKMAMSSLENTVRAKSKPGKFKARSPFFSLVQKEVYCIFRSPTQIFEYFLFTLLMPFIVFSYDKLLMTTTVDQAGKNMIAGAHVMVVAILAMLSNIISASAVTREGANFHNSKTIPVNYYTQIWAKFAFNAFFTFCALVITMVISFFIKAPDGGLAYTPPQLLLGTLAIFLAAVGHIALSIDMDIKNPTKNMQGNEQASITSKSTPVSIAIGLIIGSLMGFVVIMMSGMKNTLIPYLILLGGALIFAVYRLYMLALRIHAAYDKIEM